MGADGSKVILRGAASSAGLVGGFLALGTWDGLWEAVDLPQALPALGAQLGGLGLLGLAYLLWSAASNAPLRASVARAGVLCFGGGAAVIALWLLTEDEAADLGIGTLGTVICAVLVLEWALLAAGLAAVAFGRPAASDLD